MLAYLLATCPRAYIPTFPARGTDRGLRRAAPSLRRGRPRAAPRAGTWPPGDTARLGARRPRGRAGADTLVRAGEQ